MKKYLILTLFLLGFALTSQAQEAAPIIKELRMLIAAIPANFSSLKGKVARTDESGATIFYETPAPTSGMAQPILYEKKATQNRTYVLYYNVKDLDVMKLKIMMIMVQKYMEELNAMVKIGNYTGRDYKNKSGADVTEINDAAGNHILDFQSDADAQMIILYGRNS